MVRSLPLLLLGCVDPAARYAETPEVLHIPAAPGSGRPPAHGGAAPGPPGACGGPPSDGPTVHLSGALSGAGASGVLFDLVTVGSDGARDVYSAECPGSNRFSLEVPAALGEVWLVAFVDVDGDGPDRADPNATAGPLTIGAADIDGVSLDIAPGNDLGPAASAYRP